MNRKFLVAGVMSALLFAGSHVYGQSEQQIYAGVGLGLDYGGIVGAKVEYLPIKNFGVFGGLGYNLASVGWNAGVTYKILPDNRVSPNLLAFYGYNGVSKGAPEYEMTSYGVSFGANVDIAVGSKGHKVSAGLFVPVRSSKFRDNYDAMKNDQLIKVKSGLTPIVVGLGFNFALK